MAHITSAEIEKHAAILAAESKTMSIAEMLETISRLADNFSKVTLQEILLGAAKQANEHSKEQNNVDASACSALPLQAT